MSHERHALYSLSQAHLIGQDPVDALVVEIGQPVHSLQLVLLQSAVEHLGLRQLLVGLQHGRGQAERVVDCMGYKNTESHGSRSGRNLEVISAYKILADLQQSFQAWPVHYRRYSTNNKRIEDI